MSKKFEFYTEYQLPLLLGIKVHNVNELIAHLKTVPPASIYYHTHRFHKVHHYLIPEPPNDFAYWIRNTLNLRELGELIASINAITFKDLEDLRKIFLELFENYKNKDAYSVNCPKGDEFQFMSCATFCFPSGRTAENLVEFLEILEGISVNSLHYHIFEAQLRRGKKYNDFAEWFERIGETELSANVTLIDPYTMTMQALRNNLIFMIRKYGKFK